MFACKHFLFIFTYIKRKVVFIILIKDNKIVSWKTPVISLEDKPKLTAVNLKACFDSNSNELKDSLNGVIDTLTSKTGADNIGITQIDNTDGSTVQQALQNLSDKLTKVDPYLGNPVAITQGGTGAKTVQDALFKLGAKPNDNLLLNWYFVGGGSQLGDGMFPINQRSNTRYGGLEYSIDGYKLFNVALLELLTDKIAIFINQLGGAVFAYPKLELGKTYTLSILANAVSPNNSTIGAYDAGETIIRDGLTSHTFVAQPNTLTHGVYIFRKSSSDENQASAFIYAAKLEKGNKQTLARQLEDGSWELLEKPDYTTELLKCQRYLQVGKSPHFYTGAMYSQKEGIFIVPTPIEMRIQNPSISFNTAHSVVVRGYDSTSVLLTNEELSVLDSDCFGAKVKVTLSGNKVLPVGTAVIADAAFTLNAEL